MAVPQKETSKNIHKVVWAIDPFHEDPAIQLTAARALQCLHNDTPFTTQPVSLLVAGRYDRESHYFLETWNELEQVAEKNLEKMLKGFKLPGLLKPVLIRQQSAAQSRGVNTLLKFAFDEKADEILVSSHGRRGTSRILMGSFAESLVLRSPLPTLVVNPNVQKVARVKNILFPTDFSDKSKIAFDRVLDLCREGDTKVLLFHKMQYLYPEFGYPFVIPAVSKNSIRDLVASAEKQAAEWTRLAERKGVIVKAHVSGKPGYALDEIVRAAKKLGPSGMIAMASQSGALTSVILGSLTRQVVRSAPCPILVLHPHQDTLIKKSVQELKQTVYSYGARPLFT